MNELNFIDFHSHILPEIDDGADSLETSVEILRKLYKCGTRFIYATPHFYADSDTVDSFIKKRNAAYEKVLELKLDDIPDIGLGAEIMYCKELDNIDISPLKYSDRERLLFEFPVRTITPETPAIIDRISSRYVLTPVIAHVERYSWADREHLDELLKIRGVAFQFNYTGLKEKGAADKIRYLLKKTAPVILGSDTHRPENVDESVAALKSMTEDRHMFGKNIPGQFFDAVAYCQQGIKDKSFLI